MTSENLEKFEADRLEKLHRMAAQNIDPWGGRFAGHQAIASVRALPLPEGDRPGPAVRVAGRVMSYRDMGKVVLIDLRDWTGRIQLFLGKRQIGDAGWDIAQNIDL